MQGRKVGDSSKVFFGHRTGTTLLVMLMTLCACHSIGSSRQTTVELVTDSRLNPDEQGRPLSMVLKVYELKQREQFDQLSLVDLAREHDEQRLLGGDLVTKHELMLMPGAYRPMQWVLQPETRVIAWVAFYRNPEAKPWRQVVPVPVRMDTSHRLIVGACGIQWQSAAAEQGNRQWPSPAAVAANEDCISATGSRGSPALSSALSPVVDHDLPVISPRAGLSTRSAGAK